MKFEGSKLRKRAFTIIELLVSIAIIGILLSLMIPGIDRTLSKNRISDDAELFRAKVEEVRLLSGSVQQVDDELGIPSSNPIAYYGIHFPRGTSDYFTVVRISGNLAGTNRCSPSLALTQSQAGRGACVVQKVSLSRGVQLTGVTTDWFMVFRLPTQLPGQLQQSGTGWVETGPVTAANPIFELTFSDKRAKVYLEGATSKVSVTYESN